MNDIKRLYMYHGAEHKCINCLERGRELTVKNVKRSSRLHKRCGTSFMFFVMFVSIILFFFIRVDNTVYKVLLRIALMPVVAGVSYEIIRLAGRSNNILVKILSAPGMLIQRMTTKEPDESMIEVAIAAVEAVYDWKAFLNENFEYEFEIEELVAEDEEAEAGDIDAKDADVEVGVADVEADGADAEHADMESGVADVEADDIGAGDVSGENTADTEVEIKEEANADTAKETVAKGTNADVKETAAKETVTDVKEAVTGVKEAEADETVDAVEKTEAEKKTVSEKSSEV